MACFRHIFFENPRRVNLKLHSHAHIAGQEAVQSSKELNDAHYSSREDLFGPGGLQRATIENARQFQRAHRLHPRL